jgi:hypothetical protein
VGKKKLGQGTQGLRLTGANAVRAAAGRDTSNSPARALQRMTVHLYADQVVDLKRRAFEAAAARGHGSPDASELIREAVDTYLRAR